MGGTSPPISFEVLHDIVKLSMDVATHLTGGSMLITWDSLVMISLAAVHITLTDFSHTVSPFFTILILPSISSIQSCYTHAMCMERVFGDKCHSFIVKSEERMRYQQQQLCIIRFAAMQLVAAAALKL